MYINFDCYCAPVDMRESSQRAARVPSSTCVAASTSLTPRASPSTNTSCLAPRPCRRDISPLLTMVTAITRPRAIKQASIHADTTALHTDQLQKTTLPEDQPCKKTTLPVSKHMLHLYVNQERNYAVWRAQVYSMVRAMVLLCIRWQAPTVAMLRC